MANPAKPQESPSNPRLRGSLLPPPQTRGSSSRPLHSTLAKTANLANLLPTGTVLGFQALIPSFSNNGLCHAYNKYFTCCLICVFALACFLSSFTDSFIGPNGKLFYGIATPKGLYVFNGMNWQEDEEREGSNKGPKDCLTKYKVRFIDFIHAFVSLLVFLVFAIGDIHVVKCFFGDSADLNALLQTLPLGVGTLASFLFMLFPTTRRGIGYADMAAET